MNLKTPEIVDEIAVRRALIHACDLAGGQSAFARIHKLDQANVAAIIHGRRSPGLKIARLLGYERIIRYRKTVSCPGATSLPGVGNSPASVGAFSSS